MKIFFTFNKSVRHIDKPRVQQQEMKYPFSETISSVETIKAGIVDMKYREEKKLSEYPPYTFRSLYILSISY